VVAILAPVFRSLSPDLPPTAGRRVPRALFYLLGLGLLLRLPTFARPLLSDDEAIYGATADAMRRGAVLYRDAVDHKPPAIYFLYEAGFALFGAFQTMGAHLFVVLAVLGTGVVLHALGRGSQGEAARAGLVAAGAFLIFSTTWHDYDGLAANCELFLLLPQGLAAWLLLRGSIDEPLRRASLRHLLVGVLVGLSALCKYQGVTFLAASFTWLIAAAVLAPGGLGARAGRVVLAAALQGLGALLPALGFLALAAAWGSLPDTIGWFRFNFSYIGAGLTGAEAFARGVRRLSLVGGMALPVYVGGAAGAVAVLRGLLRWRRPPPPTSLPPTAVPSPREPFLLAWLLSAAIAVSAGGRFFGHYFHLLLPPLCLLAAPVLLRAWDKGRPARVLLVVATATPALLFLLLATALRPLAARLDHVEPPYEPVAARIAALSAPEERMFVWGNSPQLYLLARRSMGTRFSFCNYMTGESPGTGTETGARDAEANSFGPAWTMLFDDLEQRRPALFVDTAAAGWDGYEKFPVGRYPRLLAYLRTHYRPVEVVSGVAIYRRFP
jgi:hypothetical protein